jgi:UDP-N-acetylglucosamine 2-epimerase (non-hydrolysing)
MEAGNRCFDQRVPEEINRKIVDHLSDINMVITEHARRYLLAEGLPPDRIFQIGSHLPEVFETFRPKIEASNVLDRLGLSSGEFFVVSAHREENVDTEPRLSLLLDALQGLAKEYRVPVIVSTHPRTRSRLNAVSTEALDPLIRFEKPFGFFDYIRLQQCAKCVISDSGTITEESAILGFPAVTIRDCHERPEGMDEGVLIMCGLERQGVLGAVEMMIASATDRKSVLVEAYQSKAVSQKVLQLVHSYVPYVRRKVWGIIN